MKRLWLFLIIILVSVTAQATYLNNQAFGLGNGFYITVNTTTIDDSNQLACCDNNELMMLINGSMTNYTAGANKTITSVTLNNVTDVFTFPVTGDAGYLNFSVIMQNASNSYNLTANGAFVESRNTTADGRVWFNYTGDATLSVSWNATFAEPAITSYSPADLTPTIDVNALANFSAGANQSVTWTWTGATEGAGDGTANSSATQTWTTTGAKTVSVSCSNTKGSCGTIQWDVTVVSDGGGGGTDWDYLTGTVTPTGSTITINPSVSGSPATGGAYTFGYVFVDGQTYWVNVTMVGYTANNTQITFNQDHEVWDVTLIAPAPSITSLNNSKTNTAATTISVTVGDTVTFSAGTNQIVTTWAWGGATKLGGDGTTNSTASKTFSSVGSTSVTVYGTNSNGTSTTSTWIVNVAQVNPYNYTVAYKYGCDQTRSGGVSFEFMKSFNAITLFIIVVLLIFIIKMIQEYLLVGILSTVIIIVFIGTLLPSIAGWSGEVACIDWSESHNISGQQDAWINLGYGNIKSGSETVSNSTYIGVLNIDYQMDYAAGKFKPLSTGDLIFGS